MNKELLTFSVIAVLLLGCFYHADRPVTLCRKPVDVEVADNQTQRILELEGAVDYWRKEVLLLRVCECESDFRHDDTWGDGGDSYGAWQFQRDTFEDFKRYSGRDDWNWYNRDHQEAAARWAFENGYAERWTCYGKVIEQRPELAIR